MNYNRKFEKKARSRHVLAFSLALMVHLVLMAAVIYSADLSHYLPEFLQNLFGQSSAPNVP